MGHYGFIFLFAMSYSTEMSFSVNGNKTLSSVILGIAKSWIYVQMQLIALPEVSILYILKYEKII